MSATVEQLTVFLQTLEDCDDRRRAWKAAKLTWREVQKGLERHPTLKARYEDFMEERKIAIQDALYNDGQSGNAASGKAYLTAVGGGKEDPNDKPTDFSPWLLTRLAKNKKDEDEPDA